MTVPAEHARGQDKGVLNMGKRQQGEDGQRLQQWHCTLRNVLPLAAVGQAMHHACSMLLSQTLI